MSGIGAIISLDDETVSQSELDQLAGALVATGPVRKPHLLRKSAGFAVCLQSFTEEDDKEVQPNLFKDRFVILFDGRVDNRVELGTSMGLSMGDLKDASDSGIFALAFDCWGRKAFNRIEGAFAVIIYDLKEHQLICARDHVGLRVLHYYFSGTRFAVASNPQALFALKWVPKRLNANKLADTLVHRGLDGESTFFQEIYRVPPGTILDVNAEKISKKRFWHPESVTSIRFKNDHDYVEAFVEKLNKAVESNLRSRTSPCATITGGLDSSSIAVTAAGMLSESGKELHTFTAVPELGFFREETGGRYFDETEYVSSIARAHKNIVPHFVRPSKAKLLQQIDAVIRFAASPSNGIPNDLWVTDILSAARSSGHNVLLSGEMGNYTMSYSGWPLFSELIMSGQWLTLIRELASSGSRWKYLLRRCVLAPFVPAPMFRRYKGWRRGGGFPWDHYSAIHPQFAIESSVDERAAREFLPFDSPPARDSRSERIRMLHCYSETADWYGQIRASFGIDVRTPAADRRLIEFCLAIPLNQYFRNGCDRWLIRRAMRGRLPEAVIESKKVGIQAADWCQRLSRERNPMIEELARFKKRRDLSTMIDFPSLEKILKEWRGEEPLENSFLAGQLLCALPQALGISYFVENFAGASKCLQ